MKKYSNCVTPQGKFIYGIHKPSYTVANLRDQEKIEPLGLFADSTEYLNTANYPQEDVDVTTAKWVYEIPNPMPFRGTTFIDKEWADAAAADYSKMYLPQPEKLSFRELLKNNKLDHHFIHKLPRPLLLALATCSTDSWDLCTLAEISCECQKKQNGEVIGLYYQRDENGKVSALIHDYELFEAVANNPHLPDDFARAMVLRPGAQGHSEIVGDWYKNKGSHAYEYLRRNSYIAGGHYAANMADDARRYSIEDLTCDDMHGLRHLYYQRMYVKIAQLLGVSTNFKGSLSTEDLEKLRLRIVNTIDKKNGHNVATLWGWNFGFDYSPTNYRLHASHQQIHQQYALIPENVASYSSGTQTVEGELACYCAGDLVEAAIHDYKNQVGSSLFSDYFTAIKSNRRMDEREDLSAALTVWQDENVVIIVPKAQTSQWELQIITTPNHDGSFAGNIVETDKNCRSSLDIALLKAQQIFWQLGAKMVTSIEYSKRVAARDRHDQPLIYCLLPKLPFAPGAFSEAQLRFINGHYPEDFAALCRICLEKIKDKVHDS